VGWDYGYDGGGGLKELRRDLFGEFCAGRPTSKNEEGIGGHLKLTLTL
jgi:hypothetical protein